MGYHQLSYLLGFLPLVLLLFSICPKRSRRYVLASASWLYFFLCSRYLIVYLLGTTVWTYLMGIWIGKLGDGLPESASAASRKPYRKQAMAHQAVMLLANGVLFGVLFYLKYTGFFVRQLNKLVVHAGGAAIIAPRLLVPIGISFYTLEAVGYLLEVYWRRIPADRDFIRIALFLGFFPQTMEGPIARYGDTAMQFSSLPEKAEITRCGMPGIQAQSGVPRTLEEMTASAMRICWGMFKKLVVADRLNIIVATLFGEYEKQNGVLIIVAAVCYTVQLYMEFSGMMDVVIGSARLFGIRLPENFRQPFFSQTASEFWRRWHISLGAWLKDYLFYPVAASTTAKKLGKRLRKMSGRYVAKLAVSALALTPVWLFNGLWHGAEWNYIFYGIYYLVLLVLELALEPVKAGFYRRTGIRQNGRGATLLRILRTWVIIFTGEMFFRAPGLRAGFCMFRSLFHGFGISRLWDGTLLTFGLGMADWTAIIGGTAVVFLYDLLRERGFCIRDWVFARKLPVRWALYNALIFAVIIFGAYGTGYQAVDLIYAGF